ATPARLRLDTPSLPFSISQGDGPSTTQLTISNEGGGATRFTAAASTVSGGTWLQVLPGFGSVSAVSPASITIMVPPGSLSKGTYSGTITVNGLDTAQQIHV